MLAKISHNSKWSETSIGTALELFSYRVEDERPYLFIGGVHGDEPEGVRLAKEFMNWLTEVEKQQKLHELHSFLLIPCLNPDGYAKNERVNARGVDLNRNFPCRDWSQEHSKPRYFPGPRPNSEPETQALVKLIEDTNPEIIVHFHSWEPCVVYTGAPGKPCADILAENTNYESRETIGYPTPGSLGQYGWLEHQIPVICIEEEANVSLDTVWPRFSHGLKKLMIKV